MIDNIPPYCKNENVISFFKDLYFKIKDDSKKRFMRLEDFGQENYGIIAPPLEKIHLHFTNSNSGLECYIRTKKGKKFIKKMGRIKKLKKDYKIKEFRNDIKKLSFLRFFSFTFFNYFRFHKGK